MLTALKMFDPVLGFDAHVVFMPTPAGPVPLTVPLVFVGMLFDLEDLRPGSHATVWIKGLPRGRAGTAGVGRHAPAPGKFVKKPANKAEVMLGSATVEVEGKPLGYGPAPIWSCHDFGSAPPKGMEQKRRPTTSLMLPTSVVIPLQLSRPVLVGGRPTASLVAVAMQHTKRASRWICKALRKTDTARRMARTVYAAPEHKTKIERAKDVAALGQPEAKTAFVSSDEQD